MTDTRDVECLKCTTRERCDRFGCAIASTLIATGEPRDTWMESTPGVLTFHPARPTTGWKPGGPHGAKCHGGPLDGGKVLVMEGAVEAKRSLVVDGNGDGHYAWALGEPTFGRWTEGSQVYGLYWEPVV